MAIPFFKLLPDAAGYSFKTTSPTGRRLVVEGGFDVRRAEFIGMTYTFNLKFTVGPEGYQYITNFVDAYMQAPDWFNMLLLTFPVHSKYPLQRFAVQILPGSYSLEKVDGHRYVFGMTVEGYLDEKDMPTSRPYPVYIWEGYSGLPTEIGGSFSFAPSPRDEFKAGMPLLIAGELREPLQFYNNYQPESFQANYPELSNTTLVAYTLYPYDNGIESYKANMPTFTGGTLKSIRIDYNEASPDIIQAHYPALTGTLS